MERADPKENRVSVFKFLAGTGQILPNTTPADMFSLTAPQCSMIITHIYSSLEDHTVATEKPPEAPTPCVTEQSQPQPTHALMYLPINVHHVFTPSR